MGKAKFCFNAVTELKEVGKHHFCFNVVIELDSGAELRVYLHYRVSRGTARQATHRKDRF
jgi:hypothetical protein